MAIQVVIKTRSNDLHLVVFADRDADQRGHSSREAFELLRATVEGVTSSWYLESTAIAAPRSLKKVKASEFKSITTI